LQQNPEIMVEVSERVRQQAGLRDPVDTFGAQDDEPISLEN